LLENEDELQRLRKQLAVGLEGQAGSLLIMAPQLEWIIGPQKPSENLDGEVARNRCIYLLIQFFKTVARKGRPVVLFLDNMQWADNPSLQLLRQLSGQQDVQFIMTISAARDHGLVAEDPLLRLVHDLKDLSHVQALRLEHLPLRAVGHFLAETLLSSEDRVASLAGLMMEKTNGNPYFLKSLLKHLYEDGSIVFDQEQGAWSWHVEAIAQMDISDNVIDVILKKLARLSPEAQQTLKISACIGTKFNEDMLFAIKGSLSEEQIRQSLLVGAREGFIIPDRTEKAEKSEYRFQHDRIQQALFVLIPESERVDLHLMIGRFLARAVTDANIDDVIIDVIRHLNLAISRIHAEDQKLQLARWNHHAGLKALQATAYESASSYLHLARDLTGDQGWKGNYDLVYQVHLKLCEALYNAGRFDDAQAVFQTMKGKARTAMDRAQLHLMRALQLNLQGRLEEALSESLTAMRMLGVGLKRNPNPLGIVFLYLKIKRYMTPEFFTDYKAQLKPVDESIRLQMQIIRSLVVITYQLKLDNLLATCVELATYYSCRYGFTKESAGVFVNYSVLMINIFREFVLPPKLCALAEALDQHFDSFDERPYVKFVASAFTYNLYGSYDECLKASLDGEKWALQIGDITHQIYNRNASITVQNFIYHIDPDLASLEKIANNPVEGDRYWIYYLWCVPALCFVGLTQESTRFDCTYFTEATLYEKNAGNPISVIAYHLFKSMVAVVFDDKELGYEHGTKALPVLKAVSGLTEQIMTPYHFLALSQSFQSLDAGRRSTVMRGMRRMYSRIARMAKKLPKNLQMVQWIMEAELARIQGQRELAATRFDQAIQGATQASYTALVALFNDIAARFYLETGKPRIASLYFKEAYFHYDVWGAKEKLRDLKDRYEDLLGERVIKRDAPRTRGPRTTMQITTMMGTRNDNAGSELDLMAVVKASEILASELVLESLLIKLMRTAIQSTGAQNGTLVLKEDAQFHVCAEIRDGKESGLLDIPFEKSEHIPKSLIQFALRSNEPVVVDDVSTRNELQNDPYIAQYRPQSLLCVPIVNRAQICGVIYVEHMSVQGAFTLDRVKVLSHRLPGDDLYQQRPTLCQPGREGCPSDP
ncbi:MAG: AAA family ATPase, partial [Pseudobdellovibrionaceae bacterium]|nr:AAA family ATPase [Pseudobdellovibrionaceae bacterium]